jgi:hypothetical protein
MSTQRPLHSRGFIPCVQAQAPFTHCCPPLQAVPQVPQFVALVARFTHAPAQSVVPAGHVDTHAAAAHTDVVGQAFPQPPQLAGLVRGSTHAPLQMISPAAQMGASTDASIFLAVSICCT